MKFHFILLLIIGIILRFFLQFIFPAFNVDEIALGNNIKNANFIELLYPLQHGQSSPPLYLWLQKAIISISPFKFWISVKLLSFTSSVVTIFYFFKFAKKNGFRKEIFVIFTILIFNPYIIYNSLTLKQYTIDLLGVMLLVYYYEYRWFKKNNYIFFIIWTLISNIGLFSCVGYLLFLFFRNNKPFGISSIISFFKSNFKTILSPVPYLIYFIWFMKQDGASELKDYMTHYWVGAFLPLNSSIFKFILQLTHGFWVFFFSMNEYLGLFLFLVSIIFLFHLLKMKLKLSYYFNEITLLSCIFFIHLILNIFQQYPLSDRLYLYLSLLFLFLLASSLKKIFEISLFKTNSIVFTYIISIALIFSYKDYIFFKENDVVSLNEKLCLIDDSQHIFYTENAFKTVNDFNNFTDNNFKLKRELKVFKKKLPPYYLITRIPNKMKPGHKSKEENEISSLTLNNDVNLFYALKGYNIYKVD